MVVVTKQICIHPVWGKAQLERGVRKLTSIDKRHTHHGTLLGSRERGCDVP